VSVLATLAASPAAAQVGGFAGFVDLGYAHNSVDLDDDFFGNVDTDGWNGVTIGAGIAFPVDEIPNIAWQIDGNYSSQQGEGTLCEDPFDLDTCFSGDQSRIVWNLGGSLFWAGTQARLGINVNYETVTDYGSLTNGGIFAEWYLGNFTIQGKGGWLWGGGTPTGGRGNYLGAGVVGYLMPNLALGGSVGWSDLISGSTFVGGGIIAPPWPCAGPTCGRRDMTETNVTLSGEFLLGLGLPLSIFGGYTFSNLSLSENISNPFTSGGADQSNNTVFIGVRLYMGAPAGSLIATHRTGNLHPFLRGAN
jgi:hypothetical protein